MKEKETFSMSKSVGLEETKSHLRLGLNPEVTGWYCKSHCFWRKPLTPARITPSCTNPGDEKTQGSPGKENQNKKDESLRKYFQNSISQKVGQKTKTICQTSKV